MLYSLLPMILRAVKRVCLAPLVYCIDKIYTTEVHSKHEKIATSVNSLTCTPSSFLDKPRKEQLEVLAVDVIIFTTNMSLVAGLFWINSWIGISPMSWTNIGWTWLYMYLTMDLATASIHFMLDDPMTKNHPLKTIQNLAWQFQDHHDKPYDNTLPPLFHVLCNFSFALFLPLVFCYIYTLAFKVNYCAYGVAMVSFALLSQYVHRSIHYVDDQRSWWIKQLMRVGLVQSVENHHKHHKTYDCYYATLSGWTDPVMHFMTKYIPRYKHNNPDLFDITMRYMFLVMPIGYAILSKVFC